MRATLSESDLKAVWTRFRYDARNRRVGRQDGVAPLTGPWKQWVFTPEGNPLTELWKPTASGGAWTVEREYVWLEGRPLAQVEYPGPAGGNEGYVYLVHVDHLGQPRALTSTSGAVVWSASPSRPYGDLAEVTASDPANGRTIVTNLRLPGQYDERLLPSFGVDLQDRKQARRSGATPGEAKALLQWAKEYNVTPALDHIGTTHWIGGDHIRIGPVNHIPVIP